MENIVSKTIPAYPEGKNLLAGKTVLITAAAGTGIGFAVAKRCAEEGAEIVISDIHERRLGEAAERLEEVCGKKPHAFLCNVTQEEDIQNLFIIICIIIFKIISWLCGTQSR